jgi:hypothetical protein
MYIHRGVMASRQLGLLTLFQLEDLHFLALHHPKEVGDWVVTQRVSLVPTSFAVGHSNRTNGCKSLTQRACRVFTLSLGCMANGAVYLGRRPPRTWINPR